MSATETYTIPTAYVAPASLQFGPDELFGLGAVETAVRLHWFHADIRATAPEGIVFARDLFEGAAPVHHSAFEHLAGTLTVMAVCRSFGPDLPQGMLDQDAYEKLEDFQKTVDPRFDVLNDPVRIIASDGSIYGIFSLSDVLSDREDDAEFEQYEQFVIDDFATIIEHS